MNAKRMLTIFEFDQIINATDKYMNADWIDDQNIYAFLSEETLGRMVGATKNPLDEIKDNRTDVQKKIDEEMWRKGLKPMYMGKSLCKKYGLYEKYFDQNGDLYPQFVQGTPEYVAYMKKLGLEV